MIMMIGFNTTYY